MAKLFRDIDEILPYMKTTAVPTEFLTEIGRVTVNFAILERELSFLVEKVLDNTEKISLVSTSELSFRLLVSLATALVKEIASIEKAQEFSKLTTFLLELETKRNNIIHSLWGSSSEKVIRSKYTSKIKHGLRFQREELKVEDIEKIALDISLAAYKVSIFNHKVKTVLS
ncbi:MAG: hypothetical protein Q8L88_02620 [Bacteroidota bacterium]|nr:hypothetical protein [Bacteroidota bacterium]